MEGLQTLIAKAESGDTIAQYNLGVEYAGKQMFDKAVFWYKKAAEKGHAKAQNNLACCYGGGDGVEQDFETAVYWYTQAAEKGYDKAQYNLGVCYTNGYGVDKDDEEAVRLYKLAAERILRIRHPLHGGGVKDYSKGIGEESVGLGGVLRAEERHVVGEIGVDYPYVLVGIGGEDKGAESLT